MKKEGQHTGSSDELTRPSNRDSESRMARMSAFAKVKPSDSAPSPLCPPPTTSTNVTPPSSSASNTGSVPKMTAPPIRSRALPTLSVPSVSAATKLRTNGGSRATLLLTTHSSKSNAPSSKTSSSSAKGDVLFNSISSFELFPLLIDVANELLHGWFIYSSIKNSQVLSSSLINLSASKDVSARVRRHTEEPYSSVPEI